MSKIGIDLGTTYTTVCYVNERKQPLEDGYIEVYRPVDTGSVPSAVAYHKKSGKRTYGAAARDRVGDEDYWVYQHFKMLLALEDTPKLEEFVAAHPEYEPYRQRKPSEVAKDFFTDLLSAFKQDQAASKLEKVVVTMPLVWRGLGQQLDGNTGSARHKLVGAIKAACQVLNPPGVQARIEVKSEPEAAAGYFAHEYLRKHNKPFVGKMLVVDYGGGTLDLTLAEVAWNDKGMIELSTLENSGKGKPLDFALGAAGVAYDRALLKHMLDKKNSTLSAEDTAYYLNELERAKRQSTVRTSLNEWVVKGDGEEQSFNFQRIKVYPEDCEKAFQTVNAAALEEAMDEVFAAYPALPQSPELMAVLAGGFSNLAFVEHAVRRRMGISEDIEDQSDARLSLNRKEDRQFAIAMGAALVSAQLLDIDDSKTDFQIGFWAQANLTTGWGWRYFQIIERNTPYPQLVNPCWAQSATGDVIQLSGGGGVLNLGYSETGNPKVMPRRIPLDAAKLNGTGKTTNLSNLVPGWQNKDTKWTLGFSVRPDEDDVSGEAQILVHFQNLQSQEIRAYPINQLKQLADVLLVHDPVVEAPYDEAFKAFMASRQPSKLKGKSGK
ncbi:Hsp70 family protein [Rhodoferax sp.]|jgi:molecular chaperone DnaK|uniref:Hsp70 family protein n=1 Tax=Rhodoferax sp. TaxID=50421 RepID=UPI0037837726